MATIPHRIAQVYWRYFKRQWNLPDRHDYYLMQIAQEVKRVLSSKPSNVKMEQFKLDFQTEEPKPEKLTPEQVKQKKREISKMAKAIWRARVGVIKGKK